jgi:hypothetical protein
LSVRLGVLSAGIMVIVVFAGTADAQPVTAHPMTASPIDSLAPVGLLAVLLGVAGMVAGTLRRKKVVVQPENQRKVP